MHQDDRDDGIGRETLSQDTRVAVQLEFEDDCGEPTDWTATVKYYLRGVTAEDVDVDVFETEEDILGFSLELDLEEAGGDD